MNLLDILHSELNPVPVSQEIVPLIEAGGRVVSEDIRARIPLPSYDQSSRDGFALASLSEMGASYRLLEFEAFAGNSETISLRAGEACAVMTGGLIPLGASRVVPKEHCAPMADTLQLDLAAMGLPPFIQRVGEEVGLHEIIIKRGELVQAEDLGLLASTGNGQIPVYRRPRVGFFATGTELLELGQAPVAGMKFASNHYMLAELCSLYGSEGHNMGRVSDRGEVLTKLFSEIVEGDLDLVISTGGMGPGRYDLLEESFVAAGGRLVVNSLPMLPGRSTLVGWLGTTLFYGLPGTPRAIRPLFTELISRSLLAMQGLLENAPVQIEARLIRDCRLRRADVPSLQGGKLSYQDGRVWVERVARTGSPDCFMLVPAGSDCLEANSSVRVHLTRSPFSR
ncbi:molybdopterin molybdotransferase MoeA [Desulfotalea psychrophila]|uniref:Molybdopterin molybdenumtransferase n=1 Tax=Desulfotalea psychrophila (strain LSv54 / DSM 12343) TaxID=177439 RepID=Q6APY2_DESPS|nr:molybdopterin molybdotransferase MoeA [Desulfotalea psychrophila]CAG35591.1 related to molybdopterin biosynthesis protein moeA [Desulfotalea psychrophila LSv54]